MWLLGRRIQTREHDSVEDARAAMELFKRVKCSEWKTEPDKPASTVKSSVKRRRTGYQSGVAQSRPPRSVKRQRLDSNSVQFFSDHYWPQDIQLCGF